MTDSEIIAMLSDVVMEVDYDLWKETFLGEEEPEDSDDVMELVRIVKQTHAGLVLAAARQLAKL